MSCCGLTAMHFVPWMACWVNKRRGQQALGLTLRSRYLSWLQSVCWHLSLLAGNENPRVPDPACHSQLAWPPFAGIPICRCLLAETTAAMSIMMTDNRYHSAILTASGLLCVPMSSTEFSLEPGLSSRDEHSSILLECPRKQACRQADPHLNAYTTYSSF